MIELIISIVLIMAGIFKEETLWFIAAGLFAIAGNLDISNQIRKEKE